MKSAYFTACGLFVLALLLSGASESRYAEASRLLARCPQAEAPEAAGYRIDAMATRITGERMAYGGLVAAVLGALAWRVSVVRGKRVGKRMTPVIPLILFAAYGLQQFSS